MGSSFTGVLTSKALSEVLANPDLISVSSFSVSGTKGNLDPNRTTANPTWYTNTFNPVGTIQDSKIEISMIIPPSSIETPIADGNLIAEMYLYASTDGGSEYLFAIIQPPDGNPIIYSNIVSYQIDVEVQFSQGVNTGTFNFVYNEGNVSSHNIDPNAHQKRWILKEGDTMEGTLHQPNPTTIQSASGILTLDETGNSFIATGGEAITSITGWTKGLAVIRWDTPRTLTYDSTSLILLRGTNRTTQVGDVGIYEFTPTGCREISYFPVGGYALRDGDKSVNFSVDDALLNEHAVNLKQVKSLTKNIYTTYSINSGNTDSDGYADIINKYNDIEVSFKVGGVYPNLHVTFPNGNHYEISSINNVADLDDDVLYTFVIFEHNLVDLGDGTYSATVVPVQISYDLLSGDYVADEVLTSNTSKGYTITSNTLGSSAYKAFNEGESSDSSSYNKADVTIKLPEGETATIWKYYFRSSSAWESPKNWILEGSNDDGSTWTTLHSVSNYNSNLDHNHVTVTYEIPKDNRQPYSMFRFSSSGIQKSSSDSWRGSQDIDDLFLYKKLSFAGGTITEQYTRPTSPGIGDLNLLINQRPLLPELYDGTSWVEEQFVKLGEATKTAGTSGTPISYAFNGVFESSITSVTTNNTYDFSHNIGINNDYISSYGRVREDSNYGWAPFEQEFHSPDTDGQALSVLSNNMTRVAIGDRHALTNLQDSSGAGDAAATNAEIKIHVKRSF